jgi:hypothetical protein
MSKKLSWFLFLLSMISLCWGIGFAIIDELRYEVEKIAVLVSIFVYIVLTFILWKNNFFKRNN